MLDSAGSEVLKVLDNIKCDGLEISSAHSPDFKLVQSFDKVKNQIKLSVHSEIHAPFIATT